MTDKGSRPLPFETLLDEVRRLRAENVLLRQRLIAHDIPLPSLGQEDASSAHPLSASPLSQTARATASVTAERREKKEASGEESIRERTAAGMMVSKEAFSESTGVTIEQRITLFRSFFRGRDDVYARRWQSADGARSGYVPASLKDWNAINRSQPEDRRKVDQATRTLLPLTDAVIESHLSGRETIGIYPLLPDETCHVLAVDFDKQTWADDARAYLATCRELSVPAALERSRSGNGGHVWIFFDHALPAATVRKLGSLLLTRTMEQRYQVGLDSYCSFRLRAPAFRQGMRTGGPPAGSFNDRPKRAPWPSFRRRGVWRDVRNLDRRLLTTA
jgi:hypothetical protein